MVGDSLDAGSQDSAKTKIPNAVLFGITCVNFDYSLSPPWIMHINDFIHLDLSSIQTPCPFQYPCWCSLPRTRHLSTCSVNSHLSLYPIMEALPPQGRQIIYCGG